MNTPPLLRDGAAAERQARAKLVETLGYALAMAFSASGSPVLGFVIGSLVLGYGIKREGTREQQFKAYALRLCRLAVGVAAGSIIVHWDEFKQGLVEGWNGF